MSWQRPFEPVKPERFFACTKFFGETAMLPWLSMRPPSFPRNMKELRNRNWPSEPGVANLCSCKEGRAPLVFQGQMNKSLASSEQTRRVAHYVGGVHEGVSGLPGEGIVSRAGAYINASVLVKE